VEAAGHGSNRGADVLDEGTVALLRTMLNTTTYHRQHEEYYAVAPREQAVVLQRHARTLHALVDRWAAPGAPSGSPNPYAGAPDLTSPVALQLDGVLFMEGGDTPVEIISLRREVRELGEASIAAGDWLATAMQAAWDLAPALFDVDELADLLGERHRIVANDWQAAGLVRVAGLVLVRAADLLERVDFAPKALRAALARTGVTSGHVRSAAEMLDHAADQLCDFAGLVHDNERRWRVFRARVAEVVSLDRAARVAGA
jgi:hypothetical protein